MNTVQTLLALYVKLGGDLTDAYEDIADGADVGNYVLIPDCIAAISKIAETGGGGLPEDFPAEGLENAGKFIGFDASGDYEAKNAPSGGADKFYVTLTEDDSGAETVWTADKTIAEIVEAYEADQVVVALYPVGGSFFVEIPCNAAAVVSSRSVATFCGNYTLEPSTYNVASILALNTGGDDVWALDVFQKPVGVPSYSSSNNGQVLGVSSGDLAWVDGVPAYTTSEIGKVLCVVSDGDGGATGAWVDAAPLVVTLTPDQSDPTTLVGDATFLEAYTAVMNCRGCIFQTTDNGNTVSYLPLFAELDSGTGTYKFQFGEFLATGIGSDTISISTT